MNNSQLMSETVNYSLHDFDTLCPKPGGSVRVLRHAETGGFPQWANLLWSPAFNAGMREQARQMAQYTIQFLKAPQVG
jgi:hypothetical protein